MVARRPLARNADQFSCRSFLVSSERKDAFDPASSNGSFGVRSMARWSAFFALSLSPTATQPSARLSCAFAEVECAQAANSNTASASLGRCCPSRLYPHVLNRSPSTHISRLCSPQIWLKSVCTAESPCWPTNAADSKGDGGTNMASSRLIVPPSAP